MKKSIIKKNGVEIRINLMDLDPEEEEVRAEVFVNGNLCDLFEYSADGSLDRGSENAWSSGANEDLAVLLHEYFKDDQDKVRDEIYDAVEKLVTTWPKEEEVVQTVGESGLVLLGRDPQKHNHWHLAEQVDTTSPRTLAHFHTLKELMEWYDENYRSDRALFRRYRKELEWSLKETAERFARTQREVENWEYEGDLIPIETLWLMRLLSKIKGTHLGDEEGV